VTASYESNSSRSQFLRYLFYEIRNPLNSLSLGLMSLRNAFGDRDDATKEAVLILKDSVNYISDVLNDVLSMHQIEEGAMELLIQEFMFINQSQPFVVRSNYTRKTHL